MTTAKAREAALPPDLIRRLQRAAGKRLILVGGQALAFWAVRYGVPLPTQMSVVSRDIDFLAESPADVAEVRRMAAVLGGRAVIPHEKALTSLVGQAIKEISDDEYFNVDVIHRVLGGNTGLRDRALLVELDGATLKILHPIDVIGSRLINLYSLPEKQNAQGDAQMQMAIDIGQALTRDEPDERTAQKLIEVLATMATSDAGRKVAARRGLHVADAIDPSRILHKKTFRARRLPQLMKLMSEQRRAEIQALLD